MKNLSFQEISELIKNNPDFVSISVEHLKNVLEKVYKRGHKEGYDKGYSDGNRDLYY